MLQQEAENEQNSFDLDQSDDDDNQNTYRKYVMIDDNDLDYLKS